MQQKKKTYAVFGLGRYGTAVARELVDNGMEVIAVDGNQKNVNNDSFFSNKSIVLTGTLSFIGRSEASAILENECGAKMVSSVSKKTDLVIVGDNAGSKLEKANALHITIMYEEEFHQRLIDEGKILF